MKGQTYVILAIILLFFVALFAVVNVEPVEVNYIFWSGESPLVLIILFSVLMGGIITAAVGARKILQLQREVKNLRRQNNQVQEGETQVKPDQTQEPGDVEERDESTKSKNTF
ncbi:LapA family protein [Virgibacillus sediminis]|uniref:Lipopolysaccharide assembly LapA domain-containing protein n=1 Tax=Virgibacillus sediminis TaxID=202260 RepID=A0ABV7A5W0_9BACI